MAYSVIAEEMFTLYAILLQSKNIKTSKNDMTWSLLRLLLFCHRKAVEALHTIGSYKCDYMTVQNTLCLS